MNERTMVTHRGPRIKIGELPDLRIVAIDKLLFHEEPDDKRRETIEDRLFSDGMLKHPPIVADPGDGDFFIVLDGANRVTAIRNLGIAHVPVQVVRLDDPSLEIRSWHHAVEKLGRDFFMRRLARGGGMEILEGERWDGAPNLNGHLCAFTFPASAGFAVGNHTSTLGRVASLESVTALYRDTSLFDRVSYTNLDDLRLHYPDFTALVSFQPFRPSEILEIVRSGKRLPAGITRIILPKRALGIDMRLDFLELPIALEHKNRCLQDVIHRKVAERTIRFYEEPTFRFDE